MNGYREAYEEGYREGYRDPYGAVGTKAEGTGARRYEEPEVRPALQTRGE
jgi:hypothetical protein